MRHSTICDSEACERGPRLDAQPADACSVGSHRRYLDRRGGRDRWVGRGPVRLRPHCSVCRHRSWVSCDVDWRDRWARRGADHDNGPPHQATRNRFSVRSRLGCPTDADGSPPGPAVNDRLFRPRRGPRSCSSRTRIRAGCPGVLKNSVLSWYCGVLTCRTIPWDVVVKRCSTCES